MPTKIVLVPWAYDLQNIGSSLISTNKRNAELAGVTPEGRSGAPARTEAMLHCVGVVNRMSRLSCGTPAGYGRILRRNSTHLEF